MKRLTSTPRILATLALAAALPIHALQGGNVMPEYVQFTPAESPDMVSLGSGNFNYTLPLGEVPGPYGSYPLSMSYQPGIGPNQEATWVGLGWTLNPGAINRNLRGAPDDQFHGGELAFLYSYSKSSNWGVGVGYTNGVFSLNMSYSSTGGYGITAGWGFNIGILNLGMSFGNDGVGLDAGIGVKGVGINGGVNFGPEGYQGSSFGMSVSGGANGGKGTVTASIGVHHTAGQGTSMQAGMGYSPKPGSGEKLNSLGNPVTPRTSGFTITDKSLSLKAGGAGTTVSLPSSGIGIASSNGASSSSTGTANFAIVVPIPNVGIFSFGYSRSIHETWVRQATSEYLYGYMYQGGPAVFADAKTDEMNIGGTSGTGAGSIWNWNFKGKSLDRVGNPISGDILPAYDLFSVAANGISGTFRAYGLTRHSLYQSVERIDDADPTAQTLYYLMKEDPAALKQYDAEFPANPSTAAGSQDFTRYAYDYCYDQATGAATYNGMDNAGKLNEVVAGRCSRYAILKSRHLNEGNRLVAMADLETPRNVRSRMMFRFMGETGGNFGSEDPEWKASKYNQFELASATFQRGVNGVNRGFFGARRIDPILENNRNNGRLQGFRITNPDGTQYFFTQPVRAIISADYTTNRAKGAPLFVDKHSAAADDNFIDLIGNAFMDFVNFGEDLVTDPIEALEDLAGWTEAVLSFPNRAIASFFWSSPKFKDLCQVSKPEEQYNFSYSMKINPYATQWLLTEVRGPEFVLLDRNDMTKNIGYQVKFSYAEPSWYKWRFPFAPPETDKDSLPNFRLAKNAVTPENCHSDLYHGSFGVKELVYLRSIETASHRAEFMLNDSLRNPRVDGKGWIQDWSGRAQAKAVAADRKQTAMPIYVDVQMDMSAARIAGQTWRRKCADEFNANVPPAKIGQTCWWELNLQYAVDGAYLNMMPTQEQVDRMVGKSLLISGLDKSASGTYTSPGNKKHATGFVYSGFARQNLEFANQAKPELDTILPVTGKSLALGSSRLVFAAPVPMAVAAYNTGTTTPDYVNVYRVGARSCTGPTCSATLVATDTVGVTIPSSLTVGGPSGTLLRPMILQPLMVFNDFVETSGPEDNMSRNLERLRIVEKANNLPLREYRFSYDYEIQPGTLNSYDVRRDPVTNVPIVDAEGKLDLTSQYPKVASPTMEELEGKLKLKSVQEFACRNGDCSDNVPLPPFRFFYKNEKVSPLRYGEDFHGTIIASSNPQDEWGLWNKHATADNKKVRQDFADYGGVSWSMDKVVDPAGGVLEIEYERDTYKGESYADDTKAFPVSWRKCTNSNNLCVDLLPRRWEVACNRNDQLEGQYRYRVGDPVAADYAYMADLYESNGTTLKPNQHIYFQLDGNYRFEVGCGANIFGWKSNGCNRHRSVGMLGSGRVLFSRDEAQVKVPFLDQLDPDANGEPLSVAPHVRTLEMDVAFDLVDQTMKKAGEALTNRNNRTAVIPIKGIMWIKKVQTNLKGGDLRVKKLVRRDIGLVQTTRYEYAPGEMAQYPDSVLSTAFAERFSPTKSIVVMPTTYLPGISRVPGIHDHETQFLPGPTISYPKVTVTNISEDGHEVLNGKTVYEFIGPESGVPQREGGALPFVKMRMVVQRKNTAETWGAMDVRFKNSAGAYIGPATSMTRLSGNKDNEFYLHNSNAAAPYKGALFVEFTYRPVTGNVVQTVELPEAVQDYADLDLSAYFDATPTPDVFKAGLSSAKISPFTPIIVKTTTPADANTAYRDYTSFLGFAKNTEYYRWIPATPGERNDTRIPANANKYKLVKADSIIYSSVAPSGDDRFYSEGQNRRQQIGQDEEKWEYMRKIHCDDPALAVSSYGVNCDFNNKDAPYASYKGIEVTVNGSRAYAPKQMSYVRSPAFIVETVSKSGFNNSTGPGDYVVTRLTNHRFDPITGQPTFSVTYNGRASRYVPAKAARTTPAYHVNTPLAATMFERNMLSQTFREDAYTWTTAATQGDVNSGSFINFDTDNLSSASILPPRLTRVKITPFTQQYLDFRGTAGTPRPITAWDNPIVGMGEFSPRFKLTDAAGQAALADNSSLFTPSFLDGTFLRAWTGIEISSVNRFLKPLQKRDVYGIKSSMRYDPSGFHQIGVFSNAGYPETALLTAEGRSGNFPNLSAVDAWRFTGGSPAVDRNFIRLNGNFTLSNSLELSAGQAYTLEFQLHSSVERTCQVAFFTDAGALGDSKTVAVKAGLSAYQEVLSSAGYAALPAAGANRFRLACNDNVAGAVRVAYLRAYPEKAETISYIYNARGNMAQSVNEQNVSVYYEYDAAGSLAAIRNDDGQLFSTHKRELTNVDR